jgi:hypothetical protein
MSKRILIMSAAMLVAFAATSAHAQRVRGARENIAGGVTAGGAHDVRGPYGGRTVGEGGAVTDGDGNGVAGSRGCGRTGAGGRGCGAGATTWDEDGNVYHEQSGYAQGAFGNTASMQGSFERDDDGDLSGQRESEVNLANRSYAIDTTYDSDTGWDRDVDCSGSGCPD